MVTSREAPDPPAPDRRRILFSGPFAAGQAERARDALCESIVAGARDALYVVPGGAARREAIRALVRRQCAVFGVHVVTLAGLPAEIERRARVGSAPRLDPLDEELLAERAVRQACGGIFPPSVPIAGLSRQVLSLVDSLERCGASPAELEEEIRACAGEGEAERLLLEAWRAMAAMRAGLGRTRAQGVADALRLLRERPDLLEGCDVVVLESPPLDHALDRDLVAALVASAPGAVIAACEAPPQLADSAAARALAALRAMAQWEERACAAPGTAFRRAAGRVFATGTATDGPDGLPRGTELRLLEAAGDAGEVRLAARVVRRHLREGVAPEEIQIVLRSPARYAGLIAEVFAVERIPVAMVGSRAVADTGIGDVLLRLLRAALDPQACGREESLALLRTPHVDLAGRRADRFEQWVRTGGLLGFATWMDLDAGVREERARARVERFRDALLEAHRALGAMRGAEDAARVARRLARDLRLLGNAYFARMRLLRQAGDDPALRALQERAVREDNQAWEEIEGVLDRMPDLLRLSGPPARLRGPALAERWLAVLTLALRSAGVPASPPAAGAVRVVGVGGACARPARVSLVLGLQEKAFPRQSRQDVFLRDDLRRALRERRGWFLPSSDERAQQEREHFLRAICSAREVLYLSCAATDAEGRPALRSFFLQDLERVCPAAGVERLGVSDLTAPLADAARPADLLAALAHDVWQHLPATAPAALRRARAFEAHDELTRRRLDLGPLRGIRRHERRPALDPALLEGAPHRTLRLSASQLKAIGQCTYQHYVEKVLSPEALDEPAYDALRRGSLLHDAIMEWATQLGGWTRSEAALAEIDHWVAKQVAGWPPSMRQDPAGRHTVEANRRRLQDFLREELLLADAGAVRPAYHELAFGEQAEGAGRRDPASTPEAFPFAVETPAGPATVFFRGSIDRVDVVEVDGRRYGVAIDYKTGRHSKPYAKEMLDGHDLQLRLYLLALEHFWGIVPVGALYLGFGDGVRRGAVWADFADLIPGLGPTAEVKRLGAEEWDAFVRRDTPARIATLVDRLVRLDIVAEPRAADCGFCTLRPICRYDRSTVQEIHV
jgi:ATP-dependent helicase/nuclease subunit B